MRYLVESFWAPKRGNTSQEYEDARSHKRRSVGHSRALRVAVADGATESCFAGEWAELLVDSYRRGRMQGRGLGDRWNEMKQAWLHEVASRRPFPWYVEEKLRSGAFAALAGVTFQGGKEGGAWSALAVGDSCLLHCREKVLIRALPIADPEEFGNRPVLIGTRLSEDEAASLPMRFVGGWLPRDVFYLMTDALAAWVLKVSLTRESHLGFLQFVRDRRSFSRLLGTAREAESPGGILRNDDVTMLRVTLEG